MQAGRSGLFEEAAAELQKKYNGLRKLKIDTGLAGSAAESILSEWLREWLPSRIEVLKGAIISQNTLPTSQRDCVLFDRGNCPIFYRQGDAFLSAFLALARAADLPRHRAMVHPHGRRG